MIDESGLVFDLFRNNYNLNVFKMKVRMLNKEIPVSIDNFCLQGSMYKGNKKIYCFSVYIGS